MRRSFTRCPQCGEPVSQFAAGCAICGADAPREGPGEGRRRALPRLELAGRAGTDRATTAAIVAILVLLALAAPLVGLVVALVVVRDRNRAGDTRIRNVAAALALVSACVLLVPQLRFGLWSLLL